MPELKRTLSGQECLDKALECRRLAASMNDLSHRTMLENMAETWERIADDAMKRLLRRRSTLLP